MSFMARELFEVSCPCCSSTLKIDAELRAVISHAEPEKKPVIEDLAAEVAKLKGAPGRREEAFQKSFAAEKNQGQLLNRPAVPVQPPQRIGGYRQVGHDDHGSR